MQIADSLDAALDSVATAAIEAKEAVLDTAFWYGIGARAVRVAFVLFLALLVLAVVRRLKRRWVRRVQDRPTTDKRRQRVLTVADLVGSVARYVVWGVATIMLLAEIGLDVGPLLAGAGIAGLAIGFGAQTLVKDVISGLFLLFDDTIGVGDLIRFGDDAGVVEYVGLRLIKVRKFDGELLMIPAGELRVFGNKSIGFARVIVNVGLSYEEDVNRALGALEEVAREWAQTDEAKRIMLEEAPEVQAVMDLGDSAVTARVVVQVIPGEQFQAERDLRRLVKKRFDEMGIEIPFPRRTVYVKSLDDTEPDADEAAAAGA
jgi:small conductance mechanosensitive channel